MPGLENNRINGLINLGNLTRVADFIDIENNNWKIELIFNTFPLEIAKKIVQILLTGGGFEDLQVWRGDPSDEFSVKSAYKLSQENSLLPSYTNHDNLGLFRKL